MLAGKPILVVLQNTRPDSAVLARARQLAAATGARLELLLVDYNKTLVRARFLDREQLERGIEGYLHQHRRRLDTLVAELEKKKIRASARAVWSKEPGKCALETARSLDAGLLMKEIEQVGSVQRLFFTPDDWRLLRDAHLPVWLVPDGRRKPMPASVFAAVDPLHSHGKPLALDETIMRTGGGFADLLKSDFHALHVFPQQLLVADITADGGYIAADVLERVREEHRQGFAEFCEQWQVPPERRHFLEGEPGEAIAAQARHIGAGLLVLGASYERRGLRAVLGTTAERVLARAPCDVLVLHAE